MLTFKLRRFHLGPLPAEFESDLLKRLHGDDILLLKPPDHRPAPFMLGEGFQRVGQWVHQPKIRHAVTSIDWYFGHPVGLGGGRR